MSDLKHQSIEELLRRKEVSEQRISHLNAKIGKLSGERNNEGTRLVWINKYIGDKKPVQLPLKEISRRLGYPVCIVE